MNVVELSARELAAAEMRAAEAAQLAQSARERRDQLAGRMAALDAERAAIRQRRAAGDLREDDGARLELLTLDREILAEMLADAAAAAEGADRELASAKRAEAAARATLGAAEAAAEAEALQAAAGELLESLERAIEGLRAAVERMPPGIRFEQAEGFVGLGRRLERLVVAAAEGAKSACVGVPTANRPRWTLSQPFVATTRRLEYGNGALS